ncbi:hypothetical protein C1H46_024158 [Malus baccata]|uniref:Uncharacterized protein n=1 Tax=Malus baccata TaxID=106549 RepID=A0A540LUR8_MALBA|nr:hypothetical protein C1H46_024158 [Malus baccata]
MNSKVLAMAVYLKPQAMKNIPMKSKVLAMAILNPHGHGTWHLTLEQSPKNMNVPMEDITGYHLQILNVVCD